MIMAVKNNSSAIRALYEANLNIGRLNENLRDLSSGMKVDIAVDNAFEIAISDRTRQKNAGYNGGRSFDGNSQFAAFAIQSQINQLRDVKAKVVSAHGDMYEGMNWAKIQNEIDKCCYQVENIDYNSVCVDRIQNSDMAKRMTEQTMTDMVSQAAQSMEAQANHNAGQVLSLLQ